jgi:hypothetical protein
MTKWQLMLNIRRWNPWIGCVLMASAGLVGCSPKTNVSATGNVPSQYSHVYVSVQEIWFHTSATAGPDDTAWIKFPLATPVTVDLAASLGTLNPITTGLNVPVGNYAQVRLIPVDSGAAILASAQSLGAVYNSEVDYVDNTTPFPLELENPDKGIGIQTSISVKSTGAGSIFSSSSSSSSTTDSTANTTTDSTSSTGTSSTPFSLAINVDGAKDLVPFVYNAVSTASGLTGGTSAILLNPHMSAYDTTQAGAVTGTLDVASLGLTATGSFFDIQVTAESLSTDGTRHFAVNSAPVRSDGTFTLYPLATSTTTPTSYDLVIHGPAIATIIVKGVTVNVGDPTSTTPVSIGTLTPRAAASTFPVNLTTTTPLPAGALVGFYQTLPGTSEVPYLIEQQPIDPFGRAFTSDKSLSTASPTLDYGTFSSSGSTISMNTADPAEGASIYRVGASAPLFADSVLTTTVAAPSQSSTTATLVTVPVPLPASGVLGTASVTVSQTGTLYNKGYLLISHDGAIVATAPLDSALTQSAASTLTITGLPAGVTTLASALYYVSVRVWNSADATGRFNRVTYPTALDLTAGGTVAYSLTIN